MDTNVSPVCGPCLTNGFTELSPTYTMNLKPLPGVREFFLYFLLSLIAGIARACNHHSRPEEVGKKKNIQKILRAKFWVSHGSTSKRWKITKSFKLC